MARQERFPPPSGLSKMGTDAKKVAAVLRTDYLVDGATVQENPGRLTWPSGLKTHDAKKRLMMASVRVLNAYKALATDLEGISPGDLLEDAPDGLKEAARKSMAFRRGLDDALVSPEQSGRPVTGWGYEVQLAVAELRDLLEIIHAALPAEALISLRDVQRLEYAADILLAAARVEAAALACLKPSRAKGLTTDEFNVLARDYLKEHATPEHVVRVRKLQEFLKEKNPAGTCSTETIHGLPAWRAYQEALQRRGLKGKKKKPKAVGLTDKVEATIGESDPALEKLIEQQEADSEPSPLEADPPDGRPQRVRFRKQV